MEQSLHGYKGAVETSALSLDTSVSSPYTRRSVPTRRPHIEVRI